MEGIDGGGRSAGWYIRCCVAWVACVALLASTGRSAVFFCGSTARVVKFPSKREQRSNSRATSKEEQCVASKGRGRGAGAGSGRVGRGCAAGRGRGGWRVIESTVAAAQCVLCVCCRDRRERKQGKMLNIRYATLSAPTDLNHTSCRGCDFPFARRTTQQQLRTLFPRSSPAARAIATVVALAALKSDRPYQVRQARHRLLHRFNPMHPFIQASRCASLPRVFCPEWDSRSHSD